jgi:hypothetical protein
MKNGGKTKRPQADQRPEWGQAPPKIVMAGANRPGTDFSRNQPLRSAADSFDPIFNCGLFDVYQPNGRFKLSALVGLPLLTALAGAALAWPLAWLNYSGYVVSGARLLSSLLLWSLWTAWLARLGVKIFKVHGVGPALFLSVLGAGLSWAAAWPAIYYFSGSSASLVDFLIKRFEAGVVVDIDHVLRLGKYGGPDYRLYQGPWLLIWWLAELAFYGFLVGKIASSQAREPFSETSGRWYRKIKLRLIKLDRADLETLLGLQKCEVPEFLVNIENFTPKRQPRFLVRNWVQITLFQDPDWQRPFINVQLPFRRSARYKLRYYRITLEEADILMEKFQ